MCEAAGAELEAGSRQGVSAQEIKKLFVGAAGVLALSMYTAFRRLRRYKLLLRRET